MDEPRVPIAPVEHWPAVEPEGSGPEGESGSGSRALAPLAGLRRRSAARPPVVGLTRGSPTSAQRRASLAGLMLTAHLRAGSHPVGEWLRPRRA
eukprot:9382641-Alexandrium_andersonii.AAC.1